MAFACGGTRNTTLQDYLNLPQPKNKIQCMYAWVDGTLKNLRCKTRTVSLVPKIPKDLPRWEFCGSATNLDVGNIADVYAQPIALYKDPFRSGDNKLVLCETYTRKRLPTVANNRFPLAAKVEEVQTDEPWFGFQQPYTLLQKDGKLFGCPKRGFPESEDFHNCQAWIDLPGADRAYGRYVAEAHYRACLYAGINIGGLKAEIMPGQWEFQIGPCEGATIGDDVWMSRFILHRIAEEFGVVVKFEPNPVKKGTWRNASSSLTFSTKEMRTAQGQKKLEKVLSKLADRKPCLHISTEVTDDPRNIPGSQLQFSAKKGYIHASGLQSDCDPYLAASLLLKSVYLP